MILGTGIDTIEMTRMAKSLSIPSFLTSTFTISEIAENLGLSFWTVYRDITSRIKKINIDLPEGLLEKIDEKLESDKISNLKNQNGKIK